MKKYDSYKDSGIEWIGEIPSHWEVKRLKFYLDYQKGKNPKELKFEKNSTSEVYLTMDYLRNNPKQMLYVDDIDGFVQVNDNEILLLWDGSNAGEFILSKKGILSSTMAVIYLNNIKKGYSWYYLKNFEPRLKESTIGMGIPHVNGEELKNGYITIPPISEQTAIANFLDRKTSEIDEIIADKKLLLELYEEEKTAIINKAVTKGINPDAPIKDSGIEWLGEIPEHWEVKKLKMLVSKVGSGVTPRGGSSVYLSSGIPLIRSQNIHFDGLRLNDIAFISEDIDEKMSNSRVREGDVLLNITGASIGRCCYVPDGFGRGNVNQHVCIIRPNSGTINTVYLSLILRSEVGQLQINLQQTGANREGLNFEQLKNFNLPIATSLTEQQSIVQHIEAECSRIDFKKARTEELIELLTEYRTALISEVVTGKIKVIED